MTVPVLVTGGAGYIGSHAVLALKDAGWPVAVIDNLSSGFRWTVPDDVPFYQGEFDDPALLAQIFRERGIGNCKGAIMHFAAAVSMPDSLAHPLKYYQTNTARSLNLIAQALEAQVPHFIFSSTAAVYGVSQTGPLTEDRLPQPHTPYGMSKWMTEAMLADIARAHPMNYCALRYFNVAGADPALRSGPAMEGVNHLLKVASEVALGKRPHLSVYGTDYATPDGTAVRDYVHVSDLAAAHVHALEALIEDQCRSLTLNCGYGRGFSVFEVLAAVERVTGRKIERRLEQRRTGAAESLVADNAQIRQVLRWQPQHDDLDTIVRHALAWERRLADLRGT